MNKQISLDPVCGRLGAVGYFVNPPHINASDEIVDFDGIDLVTGGVRNKRHTFFGVRGIYNFLPQTFRD